MDRDEFLALPAAVALRVLFDALDPETVRAIENTEAPKQPKQPKFDRKIFRQGGIMWASECDLECLRFWHGRASESASDPKYEAANKKQAEELARWIAWREWYPNTAWSGERDSKQGVAKLPSAKPTVYPRPAGNGGGGNGHRSAPAADEEIDPSTW